MMAFAISKAQLKFDLYALIVIIALASAYIIAKKKLFYKTVFALIEKGCVDEETAKSFDELGLDKHSFTCFLLKKGFCAWGTIKSCRKNDTVKYYIPKEKKEKALSLFKSECLSPRDIVIILVLIFALFLIIKYGIDYFFD